MAGQFVSADDSADSLMHWISRINEAAKSTSYDGIFVYLHRDEIETMRVVHLNHQGAVSERIFSLNGAPREVIRDKNQVWCYLPDQKMGVHDYRQSNDKNFPRLLSGDGSELANLYQLKKLAVDRVADRMTDVVAIMPMDKDRFGYKLWIDDQTGLLLRADLVDSNARKILEQYMFVSLKVNEDIDIEDLKPRTPKRDLMWFGPADSDGVGIRNDIAKTSTKTTDSGAKTVWTCDDLPTGFVVKDRSVQMSSVTSGPLNHVVYSDGLATVSVFIESEVEGRPKQSHINRLQGAMVMGAMSAYGRQILGHHITAVGEVPVQTVRRIAESMRLK